MFLLQKYYNVAPVDFQMILESNLALGERGLEAARYGRDQDPLPRSARRAAMSCSKVPRAPCSMLTSAPIRM